MELLHVGPTEKKALLVMGSSIVSVHMCIIICVYIYITIYVYIYICIYVI